MLIPFLLITAPEIIRGEDYDEKADIFSFGIILWWDIYLIFSREEAIVTTQLPIIFLTTLIVNRELLTRAAPYADRNFMEVTLDVLKVVCVCPPCP